MEDLPGSGIVFSMTLSLYLFAWVLFVLGMPLVFVPVSELVKRLIGGARTRSPYGKLSNQALALMFVLGLLQIVFAYRVFTNLGAKPSLEGCTKSVYGEVYTCPKDDGGTERVDCSTYASPRDERCAAIE